MEKIRSGTNRRPQRERLRELAQVIRIEIGRDEEDAWKRRDLAAHGVPIPEGKELETRHEITDGAFPSAAAEHYQCGRRVYSLTVDLGQKLLRQAELLDDLAEPPDRGMVGRLLIERNAAEAAIDCRLVGCPCRLGRPAKELSCGW
jgi:hypothetical protein